MRKLRSGICPVSLAGTYQGLLVGCQGQRGSFNIRGTTPQMIDPAVLDQADISGRRIYLPFRAPLGLIKLKICIFVEFDL